MHTEKKDIKVNVTWNGVTHEFQTYSQEYRSLMDLIYDKIYISNFGDCKGIGRCGTCHVHLLNGTEEWQRSTGNENTTLSRISGGINSRLSCQIIIEEQINGLHVAVVSDEDLTTIVTK